MKIKRADAHDRFLHVRNQDFDMGQTCQNIINQRPFGDRPFYIFAHKREIALDERTSLFFTGGYTTMAEVPSHRMIWQPRLLKPSAQENSMLFKAYPGTDNIRVIWMIPQRELWAQYEKGKMTENKTVWESIDAFKHRKNELEAREEDDPTDQEALEIYRQILHEKNGFRMI